MKRHLSSVLAATLLLGAAPVWAQGTDASIVSAAEREGSVTIYAALDASEALELVRGFEARYPKVKVDYNDLSTTELYNRFISEAAAGGGSTDLMFSSAMDLQMKLVNDGYAQPYASPERANIPAWANWKDQAYGITAEPIVFAYNKRIVPEAEVPKTHADLAKLLAEKTDAYKAKVATYDPERSGVGFLYITQDMQADKGTMDLIKALGKSGTKLYTSSGTMLERIASGEHAIGYNMIGSYVRERQKRDPSMGLVAPSDYTVVMSRIAFIPKAAKHPNASKLFLDYMLSAEGQKHLANRSIGPVRTDMAADAELVPASARPIAIGPELLAYMDQTKRLKFLKDFQRAMQGK
ncbi:ABC transporter substrate-binding protein [Azospirillum sp. TSO22-1]|uniref:ABC transporter substrate-binding protein n=1 Tax=Azospirillum sp. TSO22-1 TaxID=716789 RepID=UPI000D60D2D2|nr:ABC transporter substrate-binding protein [Azospirillum sp. TSO22-1]PWC35578.1 iron ABC transporter substrate-binding protein [Azospirillum sp. TSO22-1]